MMGGSLATVKINKACVWIAAAIFAALPAISAAADDGEHLAGLKSILGDLQRGGFVIYLRHATTERSDKADYATDLSRCDGQRNLTAEGRDQAVRIGTAIRALRIPIGTVVSSPFCRTKDTAQLAFGRSAISHDLYFAIDADADQIKRQTGSLRRMLSTPPIPGTNTVIVAHSANLHEATGIWAKPEGAAFVFRPTPGGQYQIVATILPAEWGNIDTPRHSSGAR
jgi:phosphohistidine phosphatase SixA